VAFRLVRGHRHPETVISRLNSWPVRTPVNASLRPRGSPTHDSGPPWIATHSMSGVLIPFLMPVYPGAFPTFRTGAADRTHVAHLPDTTSPVSGPRQAHPGRSCCGPVSMPSSPSSRIPQLMCTRAPTAPPAVDQARYRNAQPPRGWRGRREWTRRPRRRGRLYGDAG
jgi:hypothetical protein